MTPLSVATGRVGSGRNRILLEPKERTVNTSSDQAATVIIELREGLWMLKQEAANEAPAVIRGYLSQVEVAGGIRYLARLPHLNPTQGIRLGEFWEWERAVEAVQAEQPRPLVADPYRDLRYSEPGENEQRLERVRRRRRFAGRLN